MNGKYIFGLMLYSLFVVGCQQDPNEKVEVILSTYEKSIDDYGVVAILQEGDILASHAIGIAGSEMPMTVDHRFGIGSCSKMFTAVIAFKLIEQGDFRLSDKVNSYTDVPDRFHPETTIRDLLQHTSGVGEYATADLMNRALSDSTRVWSDSVLLAEIPQPDELPGMIYQYRNTNYLILRRLLEKVTGKDYETLVEDLIISPLGLENTFVSMDNELPDLAHPMMNGTDFIQISMAGTNAISRGSGSLVSDARDLNKFIRALLLDKTLLKSESLSKMKAFRHFGSNHVGLGLFQEQVSDQIFLGHTGRQFSYLSYAYVNPATNSSVILLCNNMNDVWTEEMIEHFFLAMR
jgi:D-alanyl-D-alanine carboxypeptidase